VRRDGKGDQPKRRDSKGLQSRRDRPAANQSYARGRYERTRPCGHSGEQRGHCTGPHVRQSRIRSAYPGPDQRQYPWTNLGELYTNYCTVIVIFFSIF